MTSGSFYGFFYQTVCDNKQPLIQIESLTRLVKSAKIGRAERTAAVGPLSPDSMYMKARRTAMGNALKLCLSNLEEEEE